MQSLVAMNLAHHVNSQHNIAVCANCSKVPLSFHMQSLGNVGIVVVEVKEDKAMVTDLS